MKSSQNSVWENRINEKVRKKELIYRLREINQTKKKKNDKKSTKNMLKILQI